MRCSIPNVCTVHTMVHIRQSKSTLIETEFICKLNCGAVTKHGKEAEHEHVCPNVTVACSVCNTANVRKCDVKKHLEQCTKPQLDDIAEQFRSCQQEYIEEATKLQVKKVNTQTRLDERKKALVAKVEEMKKLALMAVPTPAPPSPPKSGLNTQQKVVTVDISKRNKEKE